MEIPGSLRAWFVVDFVVDVAIALPLLLVPEEVLPRLGWVAVDPVSARLCGAALAAIGVQSLRGRNDGVEAYRAMLGLKVIWSAAAAVGLTIALARGAPSLTFLLLSIFLGFCGIWSHYAIRFRQQARADALEPAEASAWEASEAPPGSGEPQDPDDPGGSIDVAPDEPSSSRA